MLGNVVHYEIRKEVWDNMQAIHEGKTKKDYSSGEPTGNLVSKEDNGVSKGEYVMLDGVTNSKEDMLEEIMNLIRKLDFSLKMINNLKNKLQAYDNRDHVKSINAKVEYK